MCGRKRVNGLKTKTRLPKTAQTSKMALGSQESGQNGSKQLKIESGSIDLFNHEDFIASLGGKLIKGNKTDPRFPKKAQISEE